MLFLLPVITSLIALVANGYMYGFADHTFFLPYIYSFHNSVFLADPFIASLHNHFPSIFVEILARTISLNALPAVLFIFQILTYVAVGYGIYLLSLELFNDRTSALLASFLSVLGTQWLLINGADTAVSQYVDQTSIVIPFLIFSLYFFFRKKYIWAGVLVGWACLIHLDFAAIVAFPMVFFLFRKNTTVRDRSLFIVPAIVGLLLALGFMVHKGFFTVTAGSEIQRTLFIDLNGFASRWFSVSAVSFIQFLAFLFIIFVCLVRMRPHHETELRKVSFFIGSWFALLFVALIFADIFPIAFILNIKLLRSLLWVTLFGIILISHYIAIRLEKNSSANYTELLLLTSAILIWKPLFIVSIAVYLIIEKVFRHKNQKIALTVCLIVLALFNFYISHALGASQWYSRANVFFYPIALIGIIFLFSEKLPYRKIALVSIIGVLFLLVLGDGLRQNVKASGNIVERPQDAAWKDIQIAVSQKVPVGEVVLTPPYLTGFRIFSNHQPFFELSDLGAVDYDPNYALVFQKRYQEFGYQPGTPIIDPQKLWTDLPFSRLNTIACQYQIHYAVFEVGHSASPVWRTLYSNPTYRLDMLSPSFCSSDIVSL